MRLNLVTRIGCAVAVSLMVTMSMAVVPVSAVTRGSGDFFTYSISMNMAGFDVAGSVTYSFLGTDTLSVNGQSYDVNVMSISGSASASVNLFGGSGTATLGGHVYETKGGLGVVKDDAIIWFNISIGTGSFQLVYRNQTETMSTYSPPLMDGFSPSSVGPGDSWTEAIGVTTTTKTWMDGLLLGPPSTESSQETISYVVASSVESVDTPAGAFETLRVTATDSSGDSVVYWWSSKIDNFVKQQEFSEGDSQPNISMILTEYNHGSSTSAVLFIGIGVGVALFAVIVLVVVLMMRRRPGQPTPYQPGVPVPLPYNPNPRVHPPPGTEGVLRVPEDFGRRTR